MKKVLFCFVIFTASLASADSINLGIGYPIKITAQGAYWGFNNGNPPIALSLAGSTATLQLGQRCV